MGLTPEIARLGVLPRGTICRRQSHHLERLSFGTSLNTPTTTPHPNRFIQLCFNSVGECCVPADILPPSLMTLLIISPMSFIEDDDEITDDEEA